MRQITFARKRLPSSPGGPQLTAVTVSVESSRLCVSFLFFWSPCRNHCIHSAASSLNKRGLPKFWFSIGESKVFLLSVSITPTVSLSRRELLLARPLWLQRSVCLGFSWRMMVPLWAEFMSIIIARPSACVNSSFTHRLRIYDYLPSFSRSRVAPRRVARIRPHAWVSIVALPSH